MAAVNVAPPKPPLTTDITNSPYLQPLPRAPNHDVLGYSRHYARRYQSMGKASKESWIKKLWSHVFTRKKNPNEQARVDARDAQAQEKHRERLADSVERATIMGQENVKAENNRKSVLPPIKQQNKTIRESNTNTAVARSNSTNNLTTARSKENIAPTRNFVKENMTNSGSNHPKPQTSENPKHYPSGYPRPQPSENKGSVSNSHNRNHQADNNNQRNTSTSYSRSQGDTHRSYNANMYSRSQSDNSRNASNIYSRSQNNDTNRSTNSYSRFQHSENNRNSTTRPQHSDSRPSNRYLATQPSDSRNVAAHLYARSHHSDGHRGLSTLSQSSSDRGSTRESLPSDRSQTRDPSKSAPVSRTRDKKLPWELVNSPYLPPRDRPNYRTVLMERQKEFMRTKDGSSDKREAKREYLHRAFKEPAPPTRAKPDYVHITGQVDSWRTPKLSKGVSYADIEERARKEAARAMKSSKIFSCELCFPMDAYIRHSLRKRGWVEKFNPTVQNSSCRGGTAEKLQCEDDEDFEVICGQGVPAPWEEDHGVYAIMSRLVRNFPARFIWGGRNVNSLVVKDEVLLNHWPKARYFTSKTSIVESLRESVWYSHDDWSSFFPRCYLLGDEEKDDVVDDFRLTACMSLIKWVLKIYDEDQERAILERERAIREEEEERSNEKEKAETEKAEQADRIAANAEIVIHEESEEEDSQTIFGDTTKQFCDTDGNGNADSGAEHSDNLSKENTDDSMKSSTDSREPSDLDTNNNDVDSDSSVVKPGDKSSKKKEDKDVSADKGKDASNQNAPKLVVKEALHRYKVLPEISRREQMGGQIPSKAVDWALSQCEHYLKFRQHEDLDQKSHRQGQLSHTQWDTFLKWYYRVAHEGARVCVAASKVEQCSQMLDRMREYWPQIYMDGLRNIWIAKPGAKSKGVGISFCDRLDDIMKYTDNTTLQGNYIVQKYIERPLLFYNCKFDIRQWFLVTDWNPVTVWFYKDSYLRICSQEYSYDSMHESVHLSNVSIQQFYMNGERSDKIPDNNFMDSNEFQEYLKHVGFGTVWDDIIYPGMKRAVITTVMSTLDVAETRKSAFELYGADFMIADDFVPWLLEINASPGMSPSSVDKAKLCAQVVEDTIKVVLDLREDKNADTGRFQLIYRDAPVNSNYRCVESKMYLKGARIKRSVWEKFAEIDRQAMKAEEDKVKKEKMRAERKRQKEENERKKAEEAQRLKEEKERLEREKELEKLQEEDEEDEDEEDEDDFAVVQEEAPKPKREASEIMETYCPTGDHKNSNNNCNSEDGTETTKESKRVHFDDS